MVVWFANRKGLTNDTLKEEMQNVETSVLTAALNRLLNSVGLLFYHPNRFIEYYNNSQSRVPLRANPHYDIYDISIVQDWGIAGQGREAVV